MGKFGAISFAIFYLTLTSDLFVCFISCSAEHLFVNLELQSAIQGSGHDSGCSSNEKRNNHHNNKACGERKDFSSCYKHGTYIVNENLNYKATQLSVLESIISLKLYQTVTLVLIDIKNSNNWPNNTGPPGHSRLPLYLSNNSLLI